jgi:tRNA pseudouridine38-40 synthase
MENDESASRERSPRFNSHERVAIANWKQYRCFAIGISYSGEGYHGFQFQPNLPTVEGDILKAIISAGLIDPKLADETSKQQLFWTRAARTDRGVHACLNVIACRLDADKVPVKTSREKEPLQLDQDMFCEKLNPFLPASVRCVFINRVTMRFDARSFCDRRRYEYYIPTRIGELSVDIGTLREEMQKFVGTHNFHNFTRGMSANDKSAVRHIVKISVEEAPHNEGFICVRLLGQSFLLNQIRKMVGLAVEVSLGIAPKNETIETALNSKGLVHIHMVPGEGLLLDRLFFGAYDLHKCGDYTLTTPFSWLIEDEESQGDPSVMKRIQNFKEHLIREAVLRNLRTIFDEWIEIVVKPNLWKDRQIK